jgi:DNA-binding beta-propeller fold protein YncE
LFLNLPDLQKFQMKNPGLIFLKGKKMKKNIVIILFVILTGAPLSFVSCGKAGPPSTPGAASPTSTAMATATPTPQIYQYLTQWGSFGSSTGQFDGLANVALDSAGNVYTTENTTNRIQEFSAGGIYQNTWGSSGSGSGQLNTPNGLAIDATTSAVYVADEINNRIEAFFFAGGAFSIGSLGSGVGQLHVPAAVAIHGADNSTGVLYVADSNNNRIEVFEGNGTHLNQWGSAGTGNGNFNSPVALAINSAGTTVYVLDKGNTLIQVFTSAGTFVTQWGSVGTGNGQFNFAVTFPQGLAVDASGNVFVTDTGNNRIQKFSATGTYLTQFGTSGSGNGQMSNPSGVAVDSLGDVYVADAGNSRVQLFQPN